MKTFSLIIAMVFVAGCASAGRDRGSSNLLIRGAAGGVVATGDLRLPDQLPPVGQSFQGRWQLRSSKGAFPTDAVKSGRYTGTVHKHAVQIDLNPPVKDNNVWLVGSVSNGTLSGKWQHAAYAGATDMGSFTATKVSGQAR